MLVRAGQTEAAVDLARIAGMTPAGVICEIMNEDGTMARVPQLDVDGESGPATQAAIRAFQQKAGLQVDGVAGPEAIAAIEQALPKG